MNAFVALLRAVNVGGTGKLPMAELAAMCEKAGFVKVKTYIASGNVVFLSKLSRSEGEGVTGEGARGLCRKAHWRHGQDGG